MRNTKKKENTRGNTPLPDKQKKLLRPACKKCGKENDNVSGGQCLLCEKTAEVDRLKKKLISRVVKEATEAPTDSCQIDDFPGKWEVGGKTITVTIKRTCGWGRHDKAKLNHDVSVVDSEGKEVYHWVEECPKYRGYSVEQNLDEYRMNYPAHFNGKEMVNLENVATKEAIREFVNGDGDCMIVVNATDQVLYGLWAAYLGVEAGLVQMTRGDRMIPLLSIANYHQARLQKNFGRQGEPGKAQAYLSVDVFRCSGINVLFDVGFETITESLLDSLRGIVDSARIKKTKLLFFVSVPNVQFDKVDGLSERKTILKKFMRDRGYLTAKGGMSTAFERAEIVYFGDPVKKKETPMLADYIGNDHPFQDKDQVKKPSPFLQRAAELKKRRKV